MIEQLSSEQEAQLEVYAKKGIQLGLDTGEFTVEEAENYAERLMGWLGHEYGRTIIADGPLDAWRTVCTLSVMGEDFDLDREISIDKREEIQEVSKSFVWPYLDGQFYSYYTAWVSYCREVLELDLPETWQVDDQVKFGLVYPMERAVVISKKPVAINTVDGRLHKEGGPAVEYRDGLKVYALNGVRVPEWLAVTPADKIDPKKFASIDNAEVRREFVRKVGIERIVQHVDAEELDVEGDYSLIEIDLGGETGKWPYLKMKNPSIGVWHLECVPRECRTVKEAREWRNDSDLEPEQLT